MNVGDVLERVRGAIDYFQRRDMPLLDFDVNDASMAHKQAEHLLNEFGDWSIDREYNSNLIDPL
jgi:hypothetical protein